MADSYWRFRQAREQESQQLVNSLLQALAQRAQLQEAARERESQAQRLSEERVIQDAISQRNAMSNLVSGLTQALPQADAQTQAQIQETISQLAPLTASAISSPQAARKFQQNVAGLGELLEGRAPSRGSADVTVGYGSEGRAARPPATLAPPNVGLPQGRSIPIPAVGGSVAGVPGAFAMPGAAATDARQRAERQADLTAIAEQEAEDRRRNQVLSDAAVSKAMEQLAIVQNTDLRQPAREAAAGILNGIMSMGVFPEEWAWLERDAKAALETIDPLTAAEGDAALAEAKAREALAPLEVEGKELSIQQTRVGIDNAIQSGELEAEEAFLSTGRGFDRLTEEQKANLRETLDLPAGVGLKQWGQVRFGQFFNAMRNEERYSAIQVQQGNQQVELNAQQLTRNEWLAQREQALAVRDDAQFYVDNIANAVRHGTPNVIESYVEAYENPDSQIGEQLRGLFPNKAKLQQHLRDARETQDLSMQELRVSVEAQETAHDAALLQLNQGRYLDPYFREAMRLKYERDAGQAELDIQNFAFADFATKVTALGEMAQVVPPSFWDDLPKPLADALEGTELGLEGFRAISRTAEFMRGQPARQEAWQNFQFLAEAVPEEGRKPDVLLAADGYLSEMGIDDPEARQAMLDVLQGAWKYKDAALQNMLNAAAGALAAEPGDPGFDADEAIADLNTVSDNLRSGLDAQINRISSGGCAVAVERNGNLWVIRNEDAETDTLSGDPCSQVMQTYYDRVEEYDRATQTLVSVVENRHGLSLSNPAGAPTGGETPGNGSPDRSVVGMGYAALQPIVGQLNEPQRNVVLDFVDAYNDLSQYVNPNTGQLESTPAALEAGQRLQRLRNEVQPILGNDYGRVQTILQRGQDSGGNP